jgi:ATP-dependent DNA helicase RecQ
MPAAIQAEKLPELLHRVFGHREFRPHQQEVCEAAASGRDVLLVMPTGAGKSLCYQLPALARSSSKDGGTALVISPLIALMDDQAHKLSALGLRVARIHSGLSRDDSRQACRDYLDGALDFLFIAPERMRVPGFPEMLAKRKPTLVAIDEAHCISQWGHDFRPDYRTLGQYLPSLRPAPIIALTATATPTVQRDIAAQLNLQQPAIFITGFRRSNLAVEVVELSKPQRPDFALKLLKEASSRPAIIYAQSRKDAEEYATKLHKHFPTAAYHAGLDAQTRDRVQRAFLSGNLDVVVATVAFGMGVDKADVRTVIHVALPGSVEGYYQEIGRAGRDGLPSRTILLHGFADRRLQEFFLEKNYPPTTDLERVLRVLPETFTPVNDLHNALLKKRDAIDRDTLDRAIEKLLITGVAVMDMAGDVRLAPDLSTESPRWQTSYESQVAARRAQIDRMIAFAESTTCRMAALVQHFGDTSDKALTCGLCDICNPSGNSASAAHQPNTEERRQLRTILRALEGRGTSTGKLFTDLKLTKHRDDFDTLLDALARAALITLTNDTFRTPDGKDITYKKATITEEGHDPDDKALDTVWIRSGIADAPTKKSGSKKSNATATPKASLNPQAEELFEQLRAWRTETAKPTKTPAFMILGDAVLRAIANANPQNLTAINAISGMGPAKVDRYGAAILAVCRGELSASESTATANRKPHPPKTPHPERSEGSPYSAELDNNPSATPTKEHPRRDSSQERAPLSIQRAESPVQKPATELTQTQLTLDQKLRDWRKQQAAEAGLPSFFILSDTALRNIALAEPRSLADLRQVRGLDAEKLNRFGPAVLALCAP